MTHERVEQRRAVLDAPLRSRLPTSFLTLSSPDGIGPAGKVGRLTVSVIHAGPPARTSRAGPGPSEANGIASSRDGAGRVQRSGRVVDHTSRLWPVRSVSHFSPLARSKEAWRASPNIGLRQGGPRDGPGGHNGLGPAVPDEPPPPGAGASDSAAIAHRPGVNAARGARYLLRNGWDYITYQEYERALGFFREAEARQAELNDAERLRLKQGIDRAQRGLREATNGVNSEPAYARSGVNRRAGALALATPAPAIGAGRRA